ncbi:MAG: hypothetical protein J5930_01885 [Treponema sp.]|nr:hypothetical protein [Treponema sp.]
MEKKVRGLFTTLDGKPFYKIENYDRMEDFFMTITSSSDVWNFCWSQGGISAGRIDCNHAIFPYYTADKISDLKGTSGPYTVIACEERGSTIFWEPFSTLSCSPAVRESSEQFLERAIYKNENGTQVWFEEINTKLQLAFRYGWTSSHSFGLVRTTVVTNLGPQKREISILDGCRNIMCASATADLQNNNSILLDAYKKTDIDTAQRLALFSVSSVVCDKAEPSEGLYANTCWFSTDDDPIIAEGAETSFIKSKGSLSERDRLAKETVLKGKRASCFVWKKLSLLPDEKQSWYQVFDTFLDAARIVHLQNLLKNRANALRCLESDIESCENEMTDFIAQADGIQTSAEKMTALHHRANVMFNIMRGGIFANDGFITPRDFMAFVSQRNKAQLQAAQEILKENDPDVPVSHKIFMDKVNAAGNKQIERLFKEYLPITFSRRHGDPSRPWNKFNIKLQDKNQHPILNYEGNWRDIFQNWEALAYSYPEYVEHFTAKFLNAMTADGFNPYRITRAGIDWECPEPDNPWAQYGYWGDHQVIYLQKFLELSSTLDRERLLASLDDPLYSSSNVPYRLKSYEEICEDPRNSLRFDKKLSDSMIELSAKYGSDKKLIQGDDGDVALVSFSAKVLQIVISKAANLVPGGGIWMNTQRPEWNDANNALAGWGLSVVTLCYLYRMLLFLIELYRDTNIQSFTLPAATAECFLSLGELYLKHSDGKCITDDIQRKVFTDHAGLLFQKERDTFYASGYAGTSTKVSREQILETLLAIRNLIEKSIQSNRRDDGLFHTYNTLRIQGDKMKVLRLQEMLEGQVAVLSSNLLSPSQALSVVKALKSSKMFEERQHAYMLYPNKELPLFLEKNTISSDRVKNLSSLLQRTENAILAKDENSNYHFNPDFANSRVMMEMISKFDDSKRPTAQETDELCTLYEETFKHQNFTGRSGTFYAYEGLGSIYWHMVSKLLLAVQEHTFKAIRTKDPAAKDLIDSYYDVRSGLSFNKTPDLYGAFPSDPYSHTPFGQGAKQPGMTGQVKEEVLTRWGELGVFIEDGKATFNPLILKQSEFGDGKTLSFTWCKVPVVYNLTSTKNVSAKVTRSNGKTDIFNEGVLSADATMALFTRQGEIKSISVDIPEIALI